VEEEEKGRRKWWGKKIEVGRMECIVWKKTEAVEVRFVFPLLILQGVLQ
jgi:hypothetical protein